MALIEINATVVELEDGSKHDVGPFRISPEEMTVGEFERFVQDTGYVTTAERSGRRSSFRSNFGINEFPVNERRTMEATLVSYIDASEYCKWSKTRLPSEAEIMAAAVVDWSSHETVTDELRAKYGMYCEQGKVIHNGSKITSTLVSPELVVIRRGPYPYLKTNWKQHGNRYRMLKPLDFCDDVTGFHVCSL